MNGTLTSTSQAAGQAFPPSPTLSSALSLSQTLGLAGNASGSNNNSGGSGSGAANDGAGLALAPYSSAADANAGSSTGSPFDLGSFGMGMDDFGTPPPQAPQAGAPSAGMDMINMYGATSAAPPAAAAKAKTKAATPTTRSAAAAAATGSGSRFVDALPMSAGTPAAAPTPGASLPTKTNPFLNKLRSMVDDPKTDELIRWGPSGETFVVPNNIRFGDEVLPRFFKHNRFTSFVRQLNMYGFHKVPALQAGALKHDTPQEAELWEFANPHFRRGRPELMAYVARRKNGDEGKAKAGKGKGKAKADSEEASSSGGRLNAVNGALMRNADNDTGALQLASVWQAIQSIQSAQKGINDNLRHLHATNGELRREAFEQRQRSKKQQDTINKMLRFLAGVFGAQDAGPGGVEQGGPGARAGSPARGAPSRQGAQTTARRRMNALPSAPRLRISDGTTDHSFSAAAGHDEELGMLESITDAHDQDEDSSMRFIEEAISNTGSPASQSGNSPPNSSTSRFVNLTASPPAEHAELPHVGAHEAVSTPGGGRRLSQQAGKQIIEALSSAQGGDWLASLFGGEMLGAAGASTPGGGFKLDQSTLGALQSVLSSATAGGGAPASASGEQAAAAATAGAGGTWNGNYFSPTVATEEDEEARFSEWTNGADAADASDAQTAEAYRNKWSDGIASASATTATPARSGASSTALVQSPGPSSLLNFGTAPAPINSNSSGGAGTTHAVPGLTPNQQAQLALTLQRASQSLHGATGDAATVQSAINVLIDGMRQDPALAAAQHAAEEQQAGGVAQFEDAGMYDASAASGGEQIADVDMDLLLREFLNAGGTIDAAPQIEEATSSAASSAGRGTGAANSPVATTGDSAGSSPGNTTAPATSGGAGAGRPGRKRAPPPEFEGVLGRDIEMANAKARRRRIGEDA